MSCSTWTDAHKNIGLLATNQDSWVMGYLTAYNTWTLKGAGDVADKLDGKRLMDSITQSCAAHPISTIADAANNLIVQLEIRRRNANGVPVPHR